MSGFYYENSDGRIINFLSSPFIGVKTNGLLSFAWKYVTQGQAVQRVVKFEKQMVEKKFHVVIRGQDEKQYLSYLDRFLQYTDVDINNLRTGKLWVDDYYLNCYLIANTKNSKYLGTNMSLVEMTVLCENGNWQSEEMFSFIYGEGGGGGWIVGEYLDYNYDYNYDFGAPFDKNVVMNESYMDTDFEMIFYGPYINPSVEIGGNTYAINYNIVSGEYIRINSQKKTARLVKYNGDEVNVFMYRDRDNYIFEKIHGGVNRVEADVDLNWTVKLFYERSEPKWSNVRWI